MFKVELWMVETLEELVSPTLASILCGFLNSERGGEIYAGVRPTGEVRGLNISPKDRSTSNCTCTSSFCMFQTSPGGENSSLDQHLPHAETSPHPNNTRTITSADSSELARYLRCSNHHKANGQL